jgi:predicted dehydrogenase
MPSRGASTRRGFLKGAGAFLAAPLFIPGSALGADGRPAPSRRVTMGFVGTGSHGIAMNLRNALGQPDAQVVALCDCDAGHLRQAHQLAPDARTFADWRDLVYRDDIDAVVVSTPDHWHVPISLAAVRAGKDVLCEKPLTLTVAEGRQLSDAVARHARVFQTGSEFRGTAVFLRAAEIVRNGRIGRLQTIRVSLGNAPGARAGDPTPQPIPPGFDYEMWLGPAPWAPYTKDRCHYEYRWIFDYSGGQFSDWGGHLFDQAQWANDTEHTGPVSVEGTGRFLEKGLYNTAVEFHVEYMYANGVRMIARHFDPVVGSTGSIRYEGTEGWVTVQYPGGLWASSPQILHTPIGPNDIRLYTCPGREMRNFLDCIPTRRPTYYPAEVGHRSAAVAHIGNIAMLLGRKLHWNPQQERFVDDETANRMLSRAMREPWHL